MDLKRQFAQITTMEEGKNMIREIIGAKTVSSMLMPRRRKRKMMMPSMGAMGILAGAGIAYMAIRKNKKNQDDVLEE